MTEHTQLLVDTGTVFDTILVDVLSALTHRSYNNPILVSPGKWSYERESQPAKF
jgi:hypothetical protein